MDEKRKEEGGKEGDSGIVMMISFASKRLSILPPRH